MWDRLLPPHTADDYRAGISQQYITFFPREDGTGFESGRLRALIATSSLELASTSAPSIW